MSYLVDESFKWLQEHCLTRTRWPIVLAIVGVVLIHLGLSNFFDWKFRETLTSAVFRASVGVLFVVCGALWIAIAHKPWLRCASGLLAISMGIVAAEPAFALILHVVPNEDRLPDRVGELLQLQVPSGPSAGGFRTARFTESRTQVWTTAQVLTAILSAATSRVRLLSVEDRKHIQEAFSYIRARREAASSGWGYWAEQDLGGPATAHASNDPLELLVRKYGAPAVAETGAYFKKTFVLPAALRELQPDAPHVTREAVTEIAGWVVVADASAYQDKSWGDEARNQMRADIADGVHLILTRQNHSADTARAGGFSPIPDTRYVRTYSTAMSLWALVEARHSQAIGHEFDSQIGLAADWLLEHRDSSGWYTDPLRAHGKNEWYPGLSGQVLHVLRLAETEGLVTDKQAFEGARVDYLRKATAFDSRAPCLNDAVLDADQHLVEANFQLEGSSFAWMAWAPLAIAEGMDSKGISDDDRISADSVLRELDARVPGHLGTLTGSWELAENVLALSLRSVPR